MTVNGKDITGDGRIDLVIGNYSGGVAFYIGDTLTTGIADPESSSGYDFDFTIYPNPTSGKIEVRSEKSEVKSIEIFNVFGELVY